jgi:hypothetical protein
VAVAVQGRQAFVAGWRNFRARTTPGEKESFVVQSHDPATGQRLWEDDYHVDEFGFFLWHALDIEAVGGRVFGSGPETVIGMWLVRAYDASGGGVLWEDRCQPSGRGDYSYSVTQALAVDGRRVFVAGSGFNAAGNLEIIVRAYAAN